MKTKIFKIGYLSPNAKLGGAEQCIRILMRNHNKQRFQSSILFLRGGPLVQEFKDEGFRVTTINEFRLRQPIKWLAAEKSIIHWIRNEGIDLVHNTMAYGHLVGGPAALLVRKPCVWFQHGPIGGNLDKLASLVPSRAILANSKFTEAEQQKINLLKIPIHNLYGGIQRPVHFFQALENRNALRKKIGFDVDDIVVGHLARIQKWKGQVEFVEGFSRAYAKNPKLRALIVGSSSLGSQDDERVLRAKIRDLDLEKVCLLPGFISNIEEAYACMDVFVHSSTQPEPLGLTYIEAMARGIPVLASRLGGPSEVIQNGINGILIDPKDYQQMSEAILDCANKRNGAMLEAAKARAEFFMEENFVKRVESLYEEILK